MKQIAYVTDEKTELIYIKAQIEAVESKIAFTSEPKLVDALCYELLGLRARMGYLIDRAKQS